MREPDVASVMTKPVVTARPDTPFKRLVEMMTDHGIGAVPVVDEQNRLLGVVSQADAIAKQEIHGGDSEPPHGDRAGRDRWHRALALTAGELMSTPVHTVPAGRPMSVAARMLANEKVRRMFVVGDDGWLAGVVSRRGRAVLAMPGVVGMRNNLLYVVDDIAGRSRTNRGYRP